MNLTVHSITTEVAHYYKVNEAELFSIRRNGDKIKYKHIAIYFIKQFTGLSLAGIGKEFPGRNGCLDHATVLNAVNSVQSQCFSNKLYRSEIEELRTIFEKMIEEPREVDEECYMENDCYK